MNKQKQVNYDSLALKHVENKLLDNLKEVKVKIQKIQGTIINEKNLGTVYSALNIARDKNIIQGIFGRLGDLGFIDKTYDFAVSVACPALDYVVVDTTHTAQLCIEYLRNNNIGIATFLILEKQKHLNAKLDDKLQTPENVPRLFDLVRIPEEKVRVAFYAGLGNCLVVNNVEQATRIAYNRENTRFRKVVTIGGTVIQESGTISGGGDKLLSGKLRLNSVFDSSTQTYQYKKEILSLDKQIVMTETNLINCKEKSKKKKKILNQLDKVKKSLLYMTSKLNKTLKTEQEMVNELNIQIRSILKYDIYNCKKDLGRNNNLIKEILCAETELIKINKIESKLRENIQKIEKKNRR